MKIVHILVALLFVAFAYVQINDPDPIGWIVFYLGISLVAIQAVAGKSNVLLPLIGMVVAFFGMALQFPDFIRWIGDGMPTITGAMKAESLYIELVREFLGFFIGFVAYLLYFMRALRVTHYQD